MRAAFLTLSFLILMADENQVCGEVRKAGKKKPPAELVRVFLADRCSAGCTEEEKKRWQKNFHWQLVYLNKDSTPEWLLYIDHADWCGAGANCSRSVYQKKKDRYTEIAEGTRLRPLRSYTNGYLDLVSEDRLNASPGKSGYWDYAFKLYQFDGKNYQLREDKIIQKKG